MENKRRRKEVEYAIVVFQSFKYQKKVPPLLPHPGSMSSPAHHMAPNFTYEAPKDGHNFPVWNTQHIFASQHQHLLQNLTVHPAIDTLVGLFKNMQKVQIIVLIYAWKSKHHRHHIFCKRFFLSRFVGRTCMLIRAGKKSMG